MWVSTWAAPPSKAVEVYYIFLSGFYNGNAAVLLFFVLSGFVLSLPITRGKQQAYSRYVLRRIVRIYGPYLGALVLALAGNAALYRRPHPTPWSQLYWFAPATGSSVLHHLLFLGFYNTERYDFVIWTLIHELRISFVLPLLYMAVQRWKGWIAVPVILLLLLFEPINGPAMMPQYVTRTSIAQSLLIAVFFATGILLAIHRERISSTWRSTSPGLQLLALSTSMVAYMYAGRIVRFASFRIHARWFDAVQQYLLISLITLVGSAGCMVAVMNTISLQRALTASPLRFLGRISYSLYLIHPIVLLTVTLLLYKSVSPWLQLPLYVAGSLLLAWLFCLIVEERCIRLSRRFAGTADRFQPTPS